MWLCVEQSVEQLRIGEVVVEEEMTSLCHIISTNNTLQAQILCPLMHPEAIHVS